MEVHTHIAVARVSSLTGGELIRVTRSGQSGLAFVVADGEEPPRMLLLEPIQHARPFASLMEIPGSDVVNFGTDWILEPIAGEESTLNNNRLFGLNGVIRLTADDVIWEGSDPTGTADAIFYSLQTNRIVESVTEANVGFGR